MYLTQALHRHLQQVPDAAASIDGDRVRTWRELIERVARFAGGLRGLGFQAGDRVAILARNGDEYMDYLYGAFWAGGVVNPINWRWVPHEIGYSLENSRTRILFIGPEFVPQLDAIRQHSPSLEQVIELGDDYERWLGAATPVPDALRRGDDLAALLYTGGTTGFPKGVMLSHRNILASAMGCLMAPGCAVGRSYLHTAPLFHIGGLGGLFMAVLSGATNIFLPAFEPKAVLNALVEHQVSDYFMVPTMIRMLINHPRFSEFDVSHLRTLRYGASPIDEALLEDAVKAFPKARFCQAYGMTELAPTVSVLVPDDHSEEARRQGRGRSAGRATSVAEIRIVNGNNEELPRGEIGEIVARGENVMLGYWELPEQTAEALRGGWMHTGDVGRMDAAGYVTVVDRLKDMIITGGENVYSAEVESVLSVHPAVAEVAVIGVPHPTWGEAVHALIVPRESPPSAEELMAHCRGTLAGYKVPRSFAFVEAFPLSGAGKVLKNVLREQWSSDASTSPSIS
jgi:acyl-CoA synthetase (AMP-forming)/AMP-acid ligase II